MRISIHFSQESRHGRCFGQRLVTVPFQVCAPPVKAPRAAARDPLGSCDRVFCCPALVLVSRPHFNNHQLGTGDVGAEIQLVANLRRRPALLEKCADRAQAFLQLSGRQWHVVFGSRDCGEDLKWSDSGDLIRPVSYILSDRIHIIAHM
jgi:hypothetical protein